MKLFHLLQAYGLGRIMSVINDMFPGANRFRPQLRMTCDMLPTMKPMNDSKAIRYKVMPGDKPDHSYVDTEDSCSNAAWEVCLGKDISRGQGVDLNDVELLVSVLISLCLQAKYPKEFEPAYQKLVRG